LSPVLQLEDWIFVLVQKDSNAKKEIYCCTEPKKIGPHLPLTQNNENKKRKSSF